MNWKTVIYTLSLLLVVVGAVLGWYEQPYSRLIINIGFTPYVLLKIFTLFELDYREWDWTRKMRLALALFMAAMLVLRYLNFYRSDLYFVLALAIDYIVGRQLSVRQGDA